MALYDPTFILQPEGVRPVARAHVLEDLGGKTYRVSFGGHEHIATSAGGRELAVGDVCSFVQGRSRNWLILASAGYPTRWRKPVSSITSTHPASAFLLLIQRNNPRTYTYLEGRVAAIIDDSTIACSVGGGRVITCPLKYGSDTQSTSGLSVGDLILIYQATPNNWEAVGYASGVIEIEIDYLPLGIWQNPDGTITVTGNDGNARVYDDSLVLSKTVGMQTTANKCIVSGSKSVQIHLSGDNSSSLDPYFSVDNGISWAVIPTLTPGVDPSWVNDVNIDEDGNILAVVSSINVEGLFSGLYLVNAETASAVWSRDYGYLAGAQPSIAQLNVWSGDVSSCYFPDALIASWAHEIYPSLKTFDPGTSQIVYYPCEGTTETRDNNLRVCESRIWEAGTGALNLTTVDLEAYTKAIYDGTDIIIGYQNLSGYHLKKWDGSSLSDASLPSPYSGLTARYPTIDFSGGVYYYIDDGGVDKLVRFPPGTTF